MRKVIKCKVVCLTNVKRELLIPEYENLQRFLHGDNSVRLYSANKQQAERFYKRVKDKEYPLSIRKDLIKVEKRNTKITKYWARIPVSGRRGGVWVAIKPHQDIPDDVEICESKLFRKSSDFYLHLTIQKEIDFVKVETSGYVLYAPPSFTVSERAVVMAINIGEANPITSVELWGFGTQRKNVRFLGKEVRTIRAHYNWLKKSVGRKKIKHALKWIKEHVAHKESRKAADVLHKATRSIVDRAIELKRLGFEPVIVFGDLKGVRKPRVKGKVRCRKNNRKVHTMPSFKIKHMLTYKALWAKIPVAIVNEAWISKQCWRCGSTNTVVRKRMFKCRDCGLEYNRDLNGSVNIGNRLLDYMLRSRADVNQPQTPPVYSARSAIQCARGEATLTGGSSLPLSLKEMAVRPKAARQMNF